MSGCGAGENVVSRGTDGCVLADRETLRSSGWNRRSSLDRWLAVDRGQVTPPQLPCGTFAVHKRGTP